MKVLNLLTEAKQLLQCKKFSGYRQIICSRKEKKILFRSLFWFITNASWKMHNWTFVLFMIQLPVKSDLQGSVSVTILSRGLRSSQKAYKWISSSKMQNFQKLNEWQAFNSSLMIFRHWLCVWGVGALSFSVSGPQTKPILSAILKVPLCSLVRICWILLLLLVFVPSHHE